MEIRYANPAMRAAIGLDEDLVGQSFDKVFPTDESNFNEVLRWVMRTSQPAMYDIAKSPEWGRRSSERHYWNVQALPLDSDSDGGVDSVLYLVQDITDLVSAQRRAEFEAREALRRAQELSESETRFRGVFENAAVGIALMSPDSQWHKVNQRFADMLGYRPEELAKLTLKDISHPDDFPVCMARTQELARGERDSYYLEKRYLHKDGRPVWVQITSSLQRHSDGSPGLIIVMIEDIGERVQAQQALVEREAALHLALEVADMATWLVDLSSGQVEFSPSLKRMFGRDMLEGPQPVDELYDMLAPEEAAHVRLAVREAIEREPHEIAVDFRLEHPSGEQRRIEVRGKVLHDKKKRPQKLIGVSLDVTPHYRLIDQLERSNRELERFAYAASHDLKEPIRIVTSYAQLLQRTDPVTGRERFSQYLEYIRKSSFQMEALVEGLLQYSRALHSSELMTEVDLEKVLEEVEQILGERIEMYNARITYEALPKVLGKHILLVQLLRNLLSNALKFRGDRPPEIHVSAKKRAAEWVISVCDNGLGIDPSQHERIFEPFRRLQRSGEPGSGLGLTLVKRAVEQHGGRIWVDSHPGEGACFRFTLPIRATQAP